MEAAVYQGYLDVETREAGQWALFQADFETLLNCWPELAGNVTASNLGFKLEASTHFSGFNNEVNLSELTRTTGLFLVGVGIFDPLGDRLTIGHQGFADNDVNTMGAAQDVDFDVEV